MSFLLVSYPLFGLPLPVMTVGAFVALASRI